MANRVFIATVLAGMLLILDGCTPRPERVVDEAGLFADAEKQHLARFHELLLADHAIDYRVITVRAAADINAYAARRFAELEVGSMSPQGHGLLLVIDADGERVRMEVGYGLEGYYPDAFVAYIENRQMVPFFSAHRVADGILATTEFIVDRAQRYRLGEDMYDEAWMAGSGGGGATARIGAVQTPPATGERRAMRSAGKSPEDTLAAYFEAMARRDANPELPIYSPETREMLRGWVVTPAQMDNVLTSYRACAAQPARFNAGGSRAVIRYGAEDRRCSPWFFQRADAEWQLDLTMMSRAIRFGRDNSWHFDLSVEHPYHFAFTDWRFDTNGFPIHTDN